MATRVRFGVQTGCQDTSWQELRETWKLVEALGYDTAWTFDHFFAILTDPSRPCFEGWSLLAALAAETTRPQIGVLVSGNTYRHPAILAKMGATVDHVSGGRLIMGLGAAWFELEHAAYGIPFYSTGVRVGRLDEAAEIIRRLWTETAVSFEGRYYRLKDAYGEPKPVQKPRPPIMIGGGGEKLTLRVVAKHADQWNTFGSPDVFRHKRDVLRTHCAAVGRNPAEIEISWAGLVLVTDSRAEKEQVLRRVGERFGQPPEEAQRRVLVGSPGEIRDHIGRFMDVGVTHFIATTLAPFARDSIRRFAEEVVPAFRG